MFGWTKKEPSRKEKYTPEPKKQNYEMPTIKFEPAKVTETVKADLKQNIKLLNDLGASNFDMIYDAALRSISAGRALDILYQTLMTIDGVGKRRAKDISHWLNNKATALMQAEEQERLGIEYATWLYSGAPCGDAEQDAVHKAANEKPYLVKKGMLLNSKWTWPGHDFGCKCISKSMIVGFDGYAGGKPAGLIE